MDTARHSSHRFSSFIEPLEQRIAPAMLVNGANLLGGGNPATGETSIGENALTLVKVTSGLALVWFDADANEITGISVGPNAALEITGDVYGDIVTNLTAAGRLSDSNNDPLDGEDGGVLLASNILSIKTSPLTSQNGSVAHIIAGGSIGNLSINGEIEGIYAGDGVYRAESAIATGSGITRAVGMDVGSNVDVNPVLIGVQSSFQLLETNAKFQSGASISTAKIGTAKELQLFAGNGFSSPGNVVTGGSGGSVKNITITSAYSDTVGGGSYEIIAGQGGNGLSGGAGGSVIQVLEKASNGLVKITAGDGGDGTTGRGGAGGSVSSLDLQSDSSSYAVTAGDGGQGAIGGAGGNLLTNNFSGKNPSTGLVLTGDFIGSDQVDDVIVINTGTGEMVLSQNTGNGTSFSQVVQNPLDPNPTVKIAAAGTTPSSALAVDIDGDFDLDVVVSYRNSSSIGVFLNDGAGVFTSSSFDLGVSPSRVLAGNFIGSASLDLAIVAGTDAQQRLYVAEGDGTGAFTLLSKFTNLGANVTDVIAAPIGGSTLDDIFVGNRSGTINALLATNDAQAAFTVTNNSLILGGAISNFDYDATSQRLLALSAATNTIVVFSHDSAGLLSAGVSPDLSGIKGTPLVARFADDGLVTADPITVLTSVAGGVRLDTYAPVIDGGTQEVTSYALGATVSSNLSLKTFNVLEQSGSDGFVALGGSLARFFASSNNSDFAAYSLPFSGKTINAVAGDGGLATATGKLALGGAGGSIIGINAEATEIYLTAGDGGDSNTGPAGAGGAVSNFKPVKVGAPVLKVPLQYSFKLIAEQALELHGGNGGDAIGAGLTSAGGRGGAVSGLNMQLFLGDVLVTTGDGGTSNGGLAGSGGAATTLTIETNDGGLDLSTGDGGEALGNTGAGGAGGAVTGLVYTMNLAKEVEGMEKAYNVKVSTGEGGDSVTGFGGAGGAITTVALNLDPAKIGGASDSTTRVSFTTGDGGNGANGGAGGAIKAVRSNSTFDNENTNGSITLDAVAMQFTTGDGGEGTAGAGGAGGSVSLAGIGSLLGVTGSEIGGLPGLLIATGKGGEGNVKGGAGGAIASVTAANSTVSGGNGVLSTNMLFSAAFLTGDGGKGGTGDGGKGGDVSGIRAGVKNDFVIATGDGGGSDSLRGGAAGNIIGIVAGTTGFGSADFLVGAGRGGDGFTGGGTGGAITTFQINAPLLGAGSGPTFLAGRGGDATNAGAIAGAGGNVTGITQNKDLNSSISLIQAGNGGDNAAGTGGAGGSISRINTIGFIGKPTDGVNNLGVFEGSAPQGLFSGRGGLGLTNGATGSVSIVTARQIAAIAAAIDSNNLFAAASSVSNITADLIGFEVTRDNQFEIQNGPASPSQEVAVDGFILATTTSAIKTINAARTTAFTFNA